MLETLIRTHLKTNVAAVGERVYAYLLPQEPTFPSLIYFLVSSVGDYEFNGDSGLVMNRYQVSVYSRSYTEAKTVAEAVKAAMKLPIDPSVSLPMVSNVSDAYEDQIGTFRVDMDFLIYHKVS